jgi:hypothetical protein
MQREVAMKLCWNPDYGPIPWNATSDREDGYWGMRDDLGIDITDEYPPIFYANDETGELWHFLVGDNGYLVLCLDGHPLIKKVTLGPGAFRLEWWPKGTKPFTVDELRQAVSNEV